MHTPFEFAGGALCLDFANSLNALFSVGSKSDEEPRDPFLRILLWYEERGGPPLPLRELRREARRNPARARAVARRGRALSAALRRVFEAARVEKPPPEEALGVLQKEIRRSGNTAELRPELSGASWSWQDPAERLDSVLAPVVRSAASLLLSGRAPEIKVCAADTCRWMFLDESRNRARKWCDMKVCGNRSKVRRYRSRTR